MDLIINQKYDYIIAGAGCAGLSLLYRMLQTPSLKQKKILLLDKEDKNKNDRTWCFWEKEDGLFESIVSHKWNTLNFFSDEFKNTFDLLDYSYKMIKGKDFYQFVFKAIEGLPNITIKKENIKSIESIEEQGIVKTENETYNADYVFNSTSLFHPTINTKNSLLQHFKGWVIETPKPHFDDKVGTLMDFSINQQYGDTFMYVLPTSKTEALIEYTLFSPVTLEQNEYEEALKDYIKTVLKIDSYTVKHEEFGIIPMSLATFKRTESERIINIGTSGGFTKASSGYTFQFIQKNTQQIISNLVNIKYPQPKKSIASKKYDLYDKTLLTVIMDNKMSGKAIFTTLFKNISPEQILKFLDNETSLKEELQIMWCVPTLKFLPAAFKAMVK